MSTFKQKQEKYKPGNMRRAAISDVSTGAVFTYENTKTGNAIARKALDEYKGVHRTEASRDSWKDISPNISVREAFTRGDYEYFRPGDAIPQKQQEIISYCMEAYRKIGIVRNVIDLMGDFGAQGVQINHPNAKIQKFYRAWFTKIHGTERSERFLNLLYRCANVVVKRRMATIGGGNKMGAMGGREITKTDGPIPDEVSTKRGVIPIRYTFLNPLTLTPIGGELSQFVGKTYYGMKIPYNLCNTIAYPKNDLEKRLVAQLPEDIVQAAKSPGKILPLDNTKLCVYHYKKDDWQIWADPLVYAILNDLIMLEKMKLADLAALDGAISQIRVWRLGNLEKGIFPTDTAINKLADILLSNPGGGAFDIIWGPDLQVQDYNTNVHQFLGDSKYVPVRNSIYEGLGVPPTLTGGSSSAGFTNNYISLKTLVQRLEYGRAQLSHFWAQEIELVRQAMGFRIPATISFDHMVLSDEAAEKNLLIQLADRNMISIEAVQERIGEVPELEKIRLKREEQERLAGDMVPKAGPWFNPEKVFEYIKLALGRGYITPKQAGIDIDESFEIPPFMEQMKKAQVGGPTGPVPLGKQKGQPSPGRPKGATDTTTRDQRTPKIRTSAEELDDTAMFLTKMTWAKDAHHQISELLTPALLHIYDKKSVRSLSSKEIAEVESVKFAALSYADMFSTIDKSVIKSFIASGLLAAPLPFVALYDELVTSSEQKLLRPLTVDETRNIQIAVYSLLKE